MTSTATRNPYLQFNEGIERLHFQERTCRETAFIPHGCFADMESVAYNPHPSASADHLRREISRLLRSGQWDEALRIATNSNDDEIYLETAVSYHRLRCNEWRMKTSRNEDCILPCREEILRAAEEGQDLLCARLLEMFLRRSSSGPENTLSHKEIRHIVFFVTKHWMLQTSLKLVNYNLLDAVDLDFYEELLKHEYTPLMATMLIREKSNLIQELARASAERIGRIESKYCYYALRFALRQSEDLANLLCLMRLWHIKVLPDKEFVCVCRFSGILKHLTDEQIVDRRNRITGKSKKPFDSLKSGEFFADFVQKPWSENFAGQFWALFKIRMPASIERVVLERFISFPVTKEKMQKLTEAGMPSSKQMCSG